MFQPSLFDDQSELDQPVPSLEFSVLGVHLQGFRYPRINQVVFSQRGVARALKAAESTVRRWLASDQFKAYNGGCFMRATLLTEANINPISVVTQADLVVLVKIGAENGNSVARSMHDASFARFSNISSGNDTSSGTMASLPEDSAEFAMEPSAGFSTSSSIVMTMRNIPQQLFQSIPHTPAKALAFFA